MTQQITGQDEINDYVEDKAGSDCSLTDGDVDRVLTLSNTILTSHERVSVDGTMLGPSQYTVSHLAASSTITFDDPVQIWDAQDIIVRYKYAAA